MDAMNPVHECPSEEMLEEVRRDVKLLLQEMHTLQSQRLDQRVRAVERFQWTLVGASSTMSVLALLVAIAGLFI
jgi:hypothetical protein